MIAYPARTYNSFGGLQADIVLLRKDVLINASLGTGSFCQYTSKNAALYRLKDTQIYYATVKISEHIQYAFALEVRNNKDKN